MKNKEALDSQETLVLPPLTKPRQTKLFSRQALQTAFQSFKMNDEDEFSSKDSEKTHFSWVNNSLDFVRAHLTHGIVDVVMSLMGFAVVINALFVNPANSREMNSRADTLNIKNSNYRQCCVLQRKRRARNGRAS